MTGAEAEATGEETRKHPWPSGAQWSIVAGEHEATVVEVGGGIRAYAVGGTEVVTGHAAEEMAVGSSGQVLAPWPNRIRDGRYTFADEPQQLFLTEPARHNAIHGLVNWARWRQVDTGPGRTTLTFELPPQPGYPWSLSLRTEWSVSDAGLRAEHTVTNIDARPCPFGFSIHPYLVIPGVRVDDLTLHVPARSRLLVDGRLLPIGAARVAGGEFDYTEPRRIGAAELDTAFGDVIRDPDGGSAVTIAAANGRSVKIWADAAFGWWQVFTSDTLTGERHRRAVAIEPMTCPPDAFRSGRDLITLEPGQSWHGIWGVTPSAP